MDPDWCDRWFCARRYCTKRTWARGPHCLSLLRWRESSAIKKTLARYFRESSFNSILKRIISIKQNPYRLSLYNNLTNLWKEKKLTNWILLSWIFYLPFNLNALYFLKYPLKFLFVRCIGISVCGIGNGLVALHELDKCSTTWAPPLNTLNWLFPFYTGTFETNWFPNHPNLVVCFYLEIFQSDVSGLVQQGKTLIKGCV